MINIFKLNLQGTFSFQFNSPGVYYYWSGFINNQQFSFNGVIRVEDTADKLLDISINLNGTQGIFFCYVLIC